MTGFCTSSCDCHDTSTLKCETEYRVLKVYVVTVVSEICRVCYVLKECNTTEQLSLKIFV